MNLFRAPGPNSFISIFFSFFLMPAILFQTITVARAADSTQPSTQHPALFIVGDSIIHPSPGPGENGPRGWGDAIIPFFDPSKIHVYVEGKGGRSSRSYIEEGIWAKVLDQVQSGDFVIIHFGHNDAKNSTNYPDRISAPGNDDDTHEIISPVTQQEELIHSYGWYLRQYVKDTLAKGATPIICSPMPRNQWINAKIKRGFDGYAQWAADAAAESGALFIDLNTIAANNYDFLGQEKGSQYFVDYQHTNKSGATLNAYSAVEALRQLKNCPLTDDLLPERYVLDSTEPSASASLFLLNPEDFHHYVQSFNSYDTEDVNGGIPNTQAWDWMKGNIPFFTCPDASVETTYYYRWWAYRKHIETTPTGHVITEFLKPVKHATEYNAISCALGLHIAEGRWLRNQQYLNDDLNFWLHGAGDGGLQKAYHQYSGWTAAALYDRWLVNGDTTWLIAQLDPLRSDYRLWEIQRLTEGGLYWQRDVDDGMEVSISGGRNVRNIRPTINSYMYANAKAISLIATLAGNSSVAMEYQQSANTLRRLTNDQLWNAGDQFYETVEQNGNFASVREELGFTPWYFNLPQTGENREVAWKQLSDPLGFYAPFGPTTAEQRNPQFQIADTGHDCQWNGPSWPFSTSITLSALANVLNNYEQTAVTNDDYWKTFLIYTHSQKLTRPGGQTIPWIDEDINPFTGVWWARAIKIRKPSFYGRGDHYNHSTYADLIINGVVGLRPRADSTVEVNPLVPANTWDWFALDGVLYHGHILTIMWDKTGTHFQKGAGLCIYSDGKELATAPTLQRLIAPL
jgi:lysophospholipase L1-like esterase